MLDFIIHLLNIEKSRIQSFHVAVLDGITHFYISLYPRYPDCPFCDGSVHIHGSSRPKKINHPVLTARKSVIVYTATRYMCNDCHRTFTEANPLTYFDIAKRNHVSVSTVQRYMDSFLTIPRQPLPVNLGIDEIHTKLAHYGNSSYLCILVDNEKRVLTEILPSRAKLELSRYFEKIDKKERDRVRYVTMDMCLPYKQVVQRYLNKRDLLDMILNINENLSLAYRLKEMYVEFNERATSSNCKDWFETIYSAFIEADIPEYREFKILLYNWKQSNAFSENINGQIRTYLTVSNGVVNFIRFRKRMFYCLNYKIFYSITRFLSSDKYDRKK